MYIYIYLAMCVCIYVCMHSCVYECACVFLLLRLLSYFFKFS